MEGFSPSFYFLSKRHEHSPVTQLVKNLPANAGDLRDLGSIPRLGRAPGEGNGNPLQYSCLETPMDRGGRQAGYSPWGPKESDMTECASTHTQTQNTVTLLYLCNSGSS